MSNLAATPRHPRLKICFFCVILCIEYMNDFIFKLKYKPYSLRKNRVPLLSWPHPHGSLGFNYSEAYKHSRVLNVSLSMEVWKWSQSLRFTLEKHIFFGGHLENGAIRSCTRKTKWPPSKSLFLIFLSNRPF